MKWIMIVLLVLLSACCPAVPDRQTDADVLPVPTWTATTVATALPVIEATATLPPTPTEMWWLTMEEIEAKYWELSEPEWNVYSQQVVGERINFAGTVLEVGPDGVVTIDDWFSDNFICALKGVPSNVLPGDILTGEGVILMVIGMPQSLESPILAVGIQVTQLY